jgi:hypothetical protein
MSTLNFNCPNCNQPIAADPAWAGLQVECPTCKGQIQVPPRPAAVPAAAPPPVIGTAAPPAPPAPKRKSVLPWILAGAALVGLLGVALVVAGIFYVRKVTTQRSRGPATSVQSPSTSPRTLTRAPMSLASVSIKGTFCGEPAEFIQGRADPAAFTFEDGKRFPEGKQMLIFLFFHGTNYANQTWTVPSGDARTTTPHIHYRSGKMGSGGSGILSSGYTMKLEFGEAVDNRIQAKISLKCVNPVIDLNGSFDLLQGTTKPAL